MSTVLDKDEATPLAPLCTSLSEICGTSDLIESYEQAELTIRGSLSGSDSETRHYQRRWEQLGRSALKYCDLVQRAAGSTIATKNSTASLGTELARLEEAVLQRDIDTCYVAVGNIAEIARSAYESACVQRDALQGFLSRLEGELAESEQALRRKKPLAKVLSIGPQQFTSNSCSPLHHSSAVANRKRTFAGGGGAMTGLAGASLVALAATPQFVALAAGTASVSVVLAGAGPLAWITVGAGVASVSLFSLAVISAITGLKSKALRKRMQELLSIIEINRYFVDQAGHHVALWDSIVTTADTACQKSGDLQRLFRYPDATRRVAHTLEATKRGFNSLTRSLNVYILYLLDRNLLPPLLEPLDDDEMAIARADLKHRARQQQAAALVGPATST